MDMKEQSNECRCSRCIHSKQVDDITYECNAEVYDIDNKTCFIPKEKEKA